jgi:hypothetical protein
MFYPKDVQRITGKSERWGCMLLLKIREVLNKEEHQFITIEGFFHFNRLVIVRVVFSFIKFK